MYLAVYLLGKVFLEQQIMNKRYSPGSLIIPRASSRISYRPWLFSQLLHFPASSSLWPANEVEDDKTPCDPARMLEKGEAPGSCLWITSAPAIADNYGVNQWKEDVFYLSLFSVNLHLQ